MEEAIGEALDLMRPLAAERSIGLAASSSLEMTTYVLADRQRLKQVLLNLLSNAVKYTARRATSLYASATRRMARSEFRCATPAPASGGKISAALYAVRPSWRRTINGRRNPAWSRPLPAPCPGDAWRHWSDSTLGSGSHLLAGASSSGISVPNPGAQKIAAPREGLSDGIGRRVLYIEDNFSNVTLVEQMLAERPALELITAMQGRVGLELARKHAPDLILLDLHLPDLPGWQVLHQLKADQATREIPVIVISADATASQIKRLLSSGASAYLTKPLDIAEFFRVIEEMLSSAETATEEAAA